MKNKMKYGEALIAMILSLLVILFFDKLARWLWVHDYLSMVFTALASIVLGAKLLQFLFGLGKKKKTKLSAGRRR